VLILKLKKLDWQCGIDPEFFLQPNHNTFLGGMLGFVAQPDLRGQGVFCLLGGRLLQDVSRPEAMTDEDVCWVSWFNPTYKNEYEEYNQRKKR